MPDVRYTLTDFQAQAMRDMLDHQRGAADALEKLGTRIKQVREAVAHRNQTTVQGIGAQLGVSIPQAGVRFDGPDEDGRFSLVWSDGEEQSEPAPEQAPEAPPAPRVVEGGKTRKKSNRRVKAS